MKPDLNNIAEIPLFFIVGRGRSGSTLLRTLFDAHPNVCIPLESRFVQYLYYQYHTVENWTIDLVIEAVDKLSRGFEPLTIEKENVLELIKDCQDTLDFSVVCKAIYLSTSSEYSKKEITYIGDKNPRYSFFIPQLIKIFPEARFIHLVRDYRDHVVSMKRSFKKINESGYTPIIITRWIHYNRQIEKYKKLYPQKFITIRFEDLIEKPEDSLKEVCLFLNLNYDKQMLEYTNQVAGYFKDENFKQLHSGLQKNFDLSKIGEASKGLKSSELILAEALAGTFASRYNYQQRINDKKFLFHMIKLVYLPVVIYGSLRFRFKQFLYPYPRIMKLLYSVLLKLS